MTKRVDQLIAEADAYLAQYESQPKAPLDNAPNESDQGYFGDSVDAFQHGLISGGADLADGVRYLTGSETVGNIADSWRGSAEEQINQMSPAGREAMQSFGINTDDGIGFNEGSSVGGFGLNVISGLGSFAPTMIPGGLAARGLSTVGKVAGATGKAGKIVDKAADVVGFGGVGALAIGGGTANQAYETVAKADLNTLAESEVFKQRYWEMRDYQEMGHEQALTEARESIAKEIAEEAAKDGAALGAISQGALGPVFGRLFRGEVGGYAKSIAVGAATEGAQELVESGGQSAIANKNVNPAIPTDTMDGVVGDALTGAMTGAAVGGGFGAGGKATRDVLNRNKPEPEDTLPGKQNEATARADELQSEIDQLDDQIQNNSDELSDAEYSALLQRREALLREQLGESMEFGQSAELEPLSDLAGPQQQQPLGLLPPENGPQPPRFDTIYGEYQPSEQQQAARETTRRSFEEPVTDARQSRKARDEAYQLQKQQQEQIEQARRERQQQEAQKRQREDQVALGQLEVGGELKAAKGAKAKAYTPSNKPIDVEYQVVEAGDLTTSHDDNFQARADYPQALQNRDRSSPALRKQVEDNAKNLIPEKLGEDSGVVSGAPIIRNGVVESGNGRTMSIRRAYNDSGAVNYRQYLENNAERLGIRKEELSQFNQPMLVRQRLNDMTPDELTSYTKDANTTDAFALNPVEQAKSDSNRVSDDDMSLIDIPESGDFAAASNRSFVRKFLGRFPKAEQNAMLNGDGTISDGGISRVQNAIFAKAYGSDQLIEDITSTSADDMKTVAKALINAAPEVAKLNVQGGVDGLTDTIVDAVNIVKRSRRDDVPVKELTDQFDLMSESTVDPTTASLANYLDQNVRSIKRMTDAIKGAAQRGQDGLRNSETDGLFGRAPAPTVANILNFGGESNTPSGKQINESGKQNPSISEKSTESGKQSIKFAASGKPYATEKSARLSRTFANTPNAKVVPVEGGFGVHDASIKQDLVVTESQSGKPVKVGVQQQNDIEVDDQALGEWSSLQHLRVKAKSYAKNHLAGSKVINSDTGREITISMSGLKHTIQGAKEDLLLTLPKTKEILENAKYIDKSEDTKGNKSVLAHHYFEVPVKVRGNTLNVRADVREMADGSFYYDHGFKRNESSDDNGSGPHLRTQGPSSESKPTSVVAEDDLIIDQAPQDSTSDIDQDDTSNGVAESEPRATKEDATKLTERIDDVGEKMIGAKKDRWKRLQDSITGEIDVASEPLSKSFPQPDYEKLVDKGESQRALALVALLRNQIPAKPKRANRLESWVKTVNAARETAAIVMGSPENATSILDSAIRARVLPKEVIVQLDMMENLPPSKLKEAATYKIGAGSFSMFNGERFDPQKVIYSIAGKHRAPELSRQGFDTAEEAAGALQKYLSETDESKSSKNAAKLDVYRDRYTGEAFVGWKSSAGVLRVEVFENTKQAREAITDRRADLEAKLNEMKRVPSMRETVNLTRVGPERRAGSVDAEQFRETFGFKGVQFGNYVEQDKRQKDLNEAYDALMDLSELLNIPPQAISLNGQLGLAFGARGHGKASAHYEADQVVINLTKKKGSGSLAHEWWHALDNYFGNKSGNALFMSDRSSRKRSNNSTVRQETADAFANVMLSIEQTGLRDRSSNLDNLRSKPYWATKVEMSARAFEAFVKTKLSDQGRSNDYLANIRSEETWGDLWDTPSYPYPTHGEMSDIVNAYKDLFETLKNRETEEGIELFSVTDTGGEGMKADDVAKTLESLVNDLHEKNTFNVVQSINDLPFGIRLQAKAKLKQSKGENPVLRGINAGDKNYLIADGLRNEKEAVEIFLHEVVGHKAVLDMLGKDGDNIMEQIAVSYGRKGLADLIKTYGVEPNTKEGRILLGKEKVAHMAEKGEKPAILKRLVSKVKAWLRNYFPSIKWSDNDLLSLISNARDNVENRYMTKVDLDAETDQGSQEDNVNLSIRGDANPKDVNDIISRTQAKPEHQKSLMERATDRLKVFKDIDTTAFKQAVIDSYASIETLEKKVNFGKLKDGAESAYKAALRTANLDSQVEAVMRRGALEFKDGAFQIKEGSKGFLEIFQKIADSEQLQLWETWAGAKRAKRIMEEDARANLDGQAALKEHRATINKLKKTTPANYPGGLTQWRKDMRAAENGMKEARTRAFQKRERLYKPSNIHRIIKYVNDTPELKKEFEQAQRDWRKFNKSMLDMAEQAGLIDPEARAIWEHDDYVPFHRVAEIEEEGGISQYATKRGLSGQKSGITQLKGGVEKLNIIESMVRNTIHLVDASNKNVAMQRVVDLADGVAMEKLPASKMDPEERDMMLRDFGYVPEDMDQDTLDAWTNQLERYNSIDKGVVSVSRNGKLHKYHVTDTGLFAAITQLGPMRVDGMLRVLGVPKRVLTASVTAAPGFMSANFVRDTLSTWVTVEAKTTPVYDAIKGAAKGLKRSESQWAIMAAGAGGGGYYDTSPDSVRQHLSPLNKGGAMHAPKRMWDAWMRVGQALENANRIAVYDSVIKDGGTVAEAAHQAQDVINFSKRGAHKWVQGAITLMPFLNARIQGLERLYRGGKENPKAFFMKGTILMGASLAILASNWDNEEYWELDEWDRDANWHIFAGGEHFKIPKPFEVGAVFGTIPERVFEQLRSDASGKLLAERMLAMITGTFAFDPFGAQVIKPAIDVMQNKNGFTGNPILGFGDQFGSPEGQYSPWTSETMKQLAESMPDSAPEWMRSPKRLEYLFKGYFGTLGGYALSLTDMATQEIVGAPDQPDTTLGRYPVVKRFYSDELTGNKHVGRFYDMTDEVNKTYAVIKDKFEDGLREQAQKLMDKNMDKLRLRSHLNKVRQQMSDISSQTRMIYMDKKMSSTEKRRRIDELTKRRNQIARAASLQFYGIF